MRQLFGDRATVGPCSRCFGREHLETARKAEIINISERNTKGRVSLNDWRSSHHPIHVRAVLQQELDRVARAVVARDVQSRRRMRSILLMLIDIHASPEQQLRELEASREVFAVSRCGEEPVAVAGGVVYVVGRVCVKPIAYAVNAAFSCVVVDRERNNHCSRVREKV